jgi:hypothetical protein
MASSKGHPRPVKRRSRPAGTERLPMICQLGGDTLANTTHLHRLQWLQQHGIYGQRADLIAVMAWGGVV